MTIFYLSRKSRLVGSGASSRLRFARRTALLAFVLILAAILCYDGSLSRARSFGHRGSSTAAKTEKAPQTKAALPESVTKSNNYFALPWQFPADTPPPATENIVTFASDGTTCGAAKSAFLLGEYVCIKVIGGPSLTAFGRRLGLVGPEGVLRNPANTAASATDSTSGVVSTLSISSDPQTFTIQLPTTASSVVDGATVDNRGEWSLNSLFAFRFLIRKSTTFSVSEQGNEAADLSVYDNLGVDPDSLAAGSTVDYVVYAVNRGPDAATNVVVSNATGVNGTLVSATQVSGSPFTCPNADTSGNCTDGIWNISSMASRSSAAFRLTYLISSGAVAGSVISNTATITSDTSDPSEANNTADAEFQLPSGAAPSECVLNCPADIVRTANTTNDNNDPGAIVTFGGAEALGSCGTVSVSHPSGSFFPVGTTVVTVSSDGGASCSFNVTVVDSAPPTISCPAPVTKNAAPGDCSATVSAADLGTPTTTGTGVDVDSSRSDGLPLDAEFPAGATTITYTATDAAGRTATCTQTVTINVNDTTPPTITAPPDVHLTTGSDATSCGRVIGDGELGTADADDNCSVHVTRTGVPAGNNFPAGTTTITYTATDGSGNTATATQHVTVTETSPPIIFAPADASYTCLSEVPAANPAQAGGPLRDTSGLPVRDENGNLVPGGTPYDNCGTPTVTVTETSSGAGSAASPKIILRTFTATDASGNSSRAVQTITVTDSTPPTISCPSDITVYLPLNSTATSTVVNYTAPTGSDNCSGATTTQTAGLASGASFPVGTTTNTYRVTDAAGNFAECSFHVTVLYNFTGFFSPVNNLPTLNVVNAGRAIPVKFSLSGNKGLSIFVANSPQSGVIPCDASAPAADLTETLNAGNSSLNYDATADQYNYVWATSNSWAGTCRQLVVTLKDGTTHTANFKFK